MNQASRAIWSLDRHGGNPMNNIIYIIGLIVVVMAVLSFLGLR
jgi:hypothetical protein